MAPTEAARSSMAAGVSGPARDTRPLAARCGRQTRLTWSRQARARRSLVCWPTSLSSAEEVQQYWRVKCGEQLTREALPLAGGVYQMGPGIVPGGLLAVEHQAVRRDRLPR
jgi:hypothetical protein